MKAGYRQLATGLGLCAAMAAHALAQPPHPWMDSSLSPDQRADLVVRAMTQDDKFHLIRSEFGNSDNGHIMSPGALNSAGYVPALPRLGLPALQESDAGLGVAKGGLNGKGATALPASLATAASFDPDLAYAGGAMIGNEAHSKGFNIMLAGGVDLQRDPRNGRNFEYAGEDPLLAGRIAGQAVRGIQSQHVVATVKHYAINALETGRMTVSSQIDHAAARESDLLAFQIAIEIGHPGSVMCAYNRVNTVYACENDWLLNKVLKGDWSYPGFVMSDWGAVHSASKAALAGLDQESAGETFDKEVYFDKPLRQAVAKGEVPQSRVDDMVHRILRSVFAVGVIDYPAKAAPINYAAHKRVAQMTEEAGAVLLRNQNMLLPLSTSLKTIAVIGGHADKGVLTGGGSSMVTSPEGNAVPGLQPQAWPGPVTYQPSAPLAAMASRNKGKVQYNDGHDLAAAARLAAQSDVAVVFVEQWTAESMDMPTMALPGNQDALIAAVAKANPKTIVVLETNGPVTMPWLGEVGAVMEAWYPGAAGGKAIARLLFGEVNPSGRLPVTWPRDESQLPRPVIQGSGFAPIGIIPKGKPADQIDYNIEGADVGYRWFQRRNLTPLFAFGHGLSYTAFGYDHFTAKWSNGRLITSFDVTNTGKRAGIDIPQIYITLPGSKQTRRLAGWQRLNLKPGETRHVQVGADPHILARYDESAHGWTRPAGQYLVELGHSSADFTAHAEVAVPVGH